MVSRTRSVSSRSKSARSGSATSTTPRVGTTYGVHGEVLSKPPQGPKHTSHRAPKKTRKHKHLVLKWVLGIFAALIAAGIGLFAYMYTTTEIPQPEKFALAEKTTVYYNDGTTPIGSVCGAEPRNHQLRRPARLRRQRDCGFGRPLLLYQ